MKYILSYSLSVLLVLGLSACYTNKEGCLDTLASNYSVIADQACDNCCTYPKLVLHIQHLAGDTTFSSQMIFNNELNQLYKIVDIRYYFSGFTIHHSSGEKVYISETISNADNSVTVKDDMKICRLADNELIIGSVKTYGSYDSISFYSGLTENIINQTFSGLPAAHVLLTNNKLKTSSGQTAHAIVKYSRTNTVNPDSVYSVFLTDLTAVARLNVNTIPTTQKGQDIPFNIKTDYLRLFKNVNLDSSAAYIENQITKNFQKVFIVN